MSGLGRIVADFESAGADFVLSRPELYEGPFCRLLAYGSQEAGYASTSDPDVMRKILLGADELVWHNGFAFDLIAAARHLGLPWAEIAGKSRDLLVDAKLARPQVDDRRGEYDLSAIASYYLGIGVGKSDALKRLKIEFGGYDRIPVDHPDYVAYAILDVELTDRVDRYVRPLDPDYAIREREIAVVAGELTLRGVRVDEALLAERLPQEAARLDVVRRRLIETWGFPEFLPTPKRNPRPAAKPWATKAGGAVLAELVEPFGDWPLTETGKLSTTAEHLRAVVADYPDTPLGEVAGLILEMTSTTLPRSIAEHLVDGRVHPSYSILTATGRWTSRRPNILGVGKRSATLLADRDLIVADEGNVFASVDLSGIDARCVAGLSGDLAYSAMFEPGVDIHTEIGAMFFGTRNRSARDAAKTVAHGINYGRQARAISKMTGLAVPEVQKLIDAYFERFAGIAEWHHEIRTAGAAGQLLPTGSGRFVRVHPSRAFTEAPARLAQSAARDLAMDGVLECVRAGLGPHVSMFIHDELVLQGPPDEIDEIAHTAIECMSFDWASPSGVVMPIVAATDDLVGPAWSDCYRKK